MTGFEGVKEVLTLETRGRMDGNDQSTKRSQCV